MLFKLIDKSKNLPNPVRKYNFVIKECRTP